VNQLIPTAEDQTATSLDIPDSEPWCVSGKSRWGEMQPLSACPARKDTFTALSVLDTVICESDADEKIVKTMDDIQDFVPSIYRQSLKQRSTYHILRKITQH
jgi:hypothetical protein